MAKINVSKAIPNVLEDTDKPFFDVQSDKIVPALSPDIPEAGGEEAGAPYILAETTTKHPDYPDIKMALRVPLGSTNEEIAAYAKQQAELIAKQREEEPGLMDYPGMASDWITDRYKDIFGPTAKKTATYAEDLRKKSYLNLVDQPWIPGGMKIPMLGLPLVKSLGKNEAKRSSEYGVSLKNPPSKWDLAGYLHSVNKDFMMGVSGTKDTEQVLDFSPTGNETLKQYMDRMESFGSGWPKSLMLLGLDIYGPYKAAKWTGKGAVALTKAVAKMTRIGKMFFRSSQMLAAAGTATHIDRALGRLGIRESNEMTQYLSGIGEIAGFALPSVGKRVGGALARTQTFQQAREAIQTSGGLKYIKTLYEKVTKRVVGMIEKKSPTPDGVAYRELADMPGVEIVISPETFQNTRRTLAELMNDNAMKVGETYPEMKAVQRSMDLLNTALEGNVVNGRRVVDIADIWSLIRILQDQVNKVQKVSGSYLDSARLGWIKSLKKDLDNVSIFAAKGQEGAAKKAIAKLKEAQSLYNQRRSLEELNQIFSVEIEKTIKPGMGGGDIMEIDLSKVIQKMKQMGRFGKDNPNYDPLFKAGLENIDLRTWAAKVAGLRGDRTLSEFFKMAELPKGKVNLYENMIDILTNANSYLKEYGAQGSIVEAGKRAQLMSWMFGMATGGMIGWEIGKKVGGGIGALFGAKLPFWLMKQSLTPRGRKFIGFLIANPPQKFARNIGIGSGVGAGISRSMYGQETPDPVLGGARQQQEQMERLKRVSPRRRLPSTELPPWAQEKMKEFEKQERFGQKMPSPDQESLMNKIRESSPRRRFP